MNVKRLTLLSILTALSLILFIVESLFPPLFIPGAKMGLSNVVTLFTLVLLGPLNAVLLVVMRTTMGALITGSISSLLYSLPAGLVSVLVSAALLGLAFPRVSLTAISVVAAVFHNITQNAVYCLITQSPQMLAYMPYLALAGAAAGLITGYAVYLMLRVIPLSIFRLALSDA